MPNTETAHVACLRSAQGAPVPLLGVSISGRVFGAHARVVLRQRYVNDESRPIEAVYTFPIPADAALVGFAMETGARRMSAVVQEREQAFASYDSAIAAGHGAALLDQERRNVFTASIGNLLPGEQTVIEVVYVQELGADEGALRLTIPTLVAPRYIGGATTGDRTADGSVAPTDRVPDADRITPKIGPVGYGFDLDLLFELGRDVKIESPSHAIAVTRDGARQRVGLQGPAVALDRDLVLVAAGAPGIAAGVVAARTPGAPGTFALTVVPDLFDGSVTAAARDVVFVVDVSGSMQGSSLEQARAALRLCLRHLGAGDRFQIVAFSNRFHTFAPQPVVFDQSTLNRADQWVAALVADGGTEMLQPLLAALGQFSEQPGRDRIVVLLTDGQIGDEAAVVEATVARVGRARIYTFGIGTNISDLLIRDLARRTRGAAAFIHPGERIDDKVTAQFARALAVRVDDLRVEFTGVDPQELAPVDLPPLVDGEPWVLYGRYESPGRGVARLRGNLRGQPFALDVAIDLPSEAAADGLTALWAAARIRELEHANLEGRRAEANRQRILALSLEHGVASAYASFVVVEERHGDRRSHAMPETRSVPVHAPAGWATPRAARGERAEPKIVGHIPMPGSGHKSLSVASRKLPSAPPRPRRDADDDDDHLYVEPMRGPSPANKAKSSAPPSLPPIPAASRPRPPAPAASSPQPAPRSIAVGSSARAASGSAHSPAAMPGAPAASPAVDTSAHPLTARFAQQLASGLWDGPDRSELARLITTADALAACITAGVDSAHPIFGTPLRKAIAALCSLVGTPIDHSLVAALERALGLALQLATGPRLRAQVEQAQQRLRELADA